MLAKETINLAKPCLVPCLNRPADLGVKFPQNFSCDRAWLPGTAMGMGGEKIQSGPLPWLALASLVFLMAAAAASSAVSPQRSLVIT